MKHIEQFAYKDTHSFSESAIPTLDCRVLLNPYRRNETDEQIMRRFDEEVRPTLAFEKLVHQGVHLLRFYDSIRVGCFGGKHRSVAVAKEIARRYGEPIQVCFRGGVTTTYGT